jgi:hypothetical protein
MLNITLVLSLAFGFQIAYSDVVESTAKAVKRVSIGGSPASSRFIVTCTLSTDNLTIERITGGAKSSPSDNDFVTSESRSIFFKSGEFDKFVESAVKDSVNFKQGPHLPGATVITYEVSRDENTNVIQRKNSEKITGSIKDSDASKRIVLLLDAHCPN